MSRKIVIAGTTRHVRGWIPDLPDHRDLDPGRPPKAGWLRIAPQVKGFPVAASSNNLKHMPAVKDQGWLGSCTAQASVAAREYLRRRKGLPPLELSELFTYAATRRLMGVPLSEDSGAQIRDAVKALAQYGVCEERLWTYRPDKFDVDPPPPCWADALAHQSLRYYSLGDLDWIRACLTMAYPVIFGFAVPQHFMHVGGDGQVHHPAPGEAIVGGHAVLAYGHDDKHDNGDGSVGALLVRNSWGEGWGARGNFWLPYSYVTEWLAMDFWAVHSASDAVF